MGISGHLFTKLYFSQNNIGSQLSHDTNGTVLKYFTSLTTLDLAYNKLFIVHENVLININDLSVLNISNNYLQLLRFSIGHMKKLKLLDLSPNLFLQIPNTDILAPEMIIANTDSSFALNLTSNPLSCSCDSHTFLKWIREKRIRIAKWESNSYKHINITSFQHLESEIIPADK